ncbi:Por secretion system C-terminal sorting domain-containing protein [Lutibacter oricola]|uniref:Por secretion system C-terminal sorting domain-containing protein n=1 Tax=Lutibacter oricola TaxID=762486 RepID=A0A1H2QID6_9FLAO|nr:LamG-like jellyroll fold domain-containing protein [Lutibacter oricola]SDW06434.1 Por secretion system C-terminal sorting domain-containing protein [Lutibacter oricola]
MKKAIFTLSFIFSLVFTTNSQTIIHSASFESSLDSWTQNSGDDFDWIRQSGVTTLFETQPIGVSSISSYINAEMSTPRIKDDIWKKSNKFNGSDDTGEENFFDSDGDGILDNIDIDDDNDGIRDEYEETSCNISNVSTKTNYKFLNETFGAGYNRVEINASYPDATTTYCYEDGFNGCFGGDDLNDGEYTVYYKVADGDGNDDTPNGEVGSWADLYWYTGEDHTSGDANGRMAMFNASYDPGLFYSAAIKGALPNVPVTYSFWVINLDTEDAPNIGSRLRPDILVEFKDVNDNVLASISTGDIPPSINGDPEASWHQFTADLLLNVDEFYVYFYNNETGGLGNDLALDDIVISQTLCDMDSDGVADVFDLDSDNDGIPDVVECGLGSLSGGTAKIPFDSSWVDANGNGMHDSAEANTPLDSDGDGIPNHMDLDSDNDTVFDVNESGAVNLSGANYVNGDGDINGNGVGNGPDTDSFRETDVDSDGVLEYFTDGILDIYDYFNGTTFELSYGNDGQGLTGVGWSYYVIDSDNDGVPDYLDSTSDGSTFDISHTLYASLDTNNNGEIGGLNYSVDIDGDGILDLFDSDTNVFGSPRDLDRKLHLYFDGRNDYAEDDASILSGLGEATIMGWIKINPTATGVQRILGQNEFYIQLNSNKSITSYANGSTLNSVVLNTNQWIHIAATYSSSNEIFKLFVNGAEVNKETISGGLGIDTANFTIGRRPNTHSNYYHGYIDEVRVFDKALSNNELQKMVYQEIESNGGNVRGVVIPRDVTDYVEIPSPSVTVLPWANLKRYYRMDTYKDDIIDDLSTNTIDVGTGARIYNVKIIDVQSAPLPFVTQLDNTTLPNAVDIPTDGVLGTDVTTYDWSIVKIEHNNISYNNYQKHLGLFVNSIDASSNSIEYSIQNNSELNISWYLELNGIIDLEGESQLIQGGESILAVNSIGYIERDQQGIGNKYRYNDWASPVILIGTGYNNTTPYSIADVLRDGTDAENPLEISFVSGYDGSIGVPIEVSEYWLYKYANSPEGDYNSWQHIGSTGSLLPGEGFLMKGTGEPGALDQNYVFIGKPNNGDVTLTVSGTNDYLVGNPYPSALDVKKFIDDNGPSGTASITGTVYFWEHYGGDSHILSQYQAGYATSNYLVNLPATSHPDVSNLGSPAKLQTHNIAVGQGFFVQGDADGGVITFKNSQRVFETESSGNSVFMRNSTISNSNEEIFPLYRLGFDGDKIDHRQIALAVYEEATDNYDYGYDSEIYEIYEDDMYFLIGEKKCVIQSINQIEVNKEIPIGVISSGGLISIGIDEIQNVDENLSIFLKDLETELYYDITLSNYETTLPIGEYNDKYVVMFKNQESLQVNKQILDTKLTTYYNNEDKEIIIQNESNLNIDKVVMYNILGQIVKQWSLESSETEINLKIAKSSGVYIVQVYSEENKSSKKILVN